MNVLLIRHSVCAVNSSFTLSTIGCGHPVLLIEIANYDV